MEEQSTNTYTNFQYSKPIIEGHFGRRHNSYVLQANSIF